MPVGCLRQVPHGRGRLSEDLALLGLDHARRDLEAGSTCPNRLRPTSAMRSPGRTISDAPSRAASREGEANAIEIEERRRHQRASGPVWAISMARPSRRFTRQPVGDGIGQGQRGTEGDLMRVERPFRAGKRQARKSRETHHAEQRAGRVVVFAGSRQKRHAFLVSAGQEHVQSALGQAQRHRHVQKGVVRTRAAKAPASSRERPPRWSAASMAISPSVASLVDGEDFRAGYRESRPSSPAPRSRSRQSTIRPPGPAASAWRMPEIGGDHAPAFHAGAPDVA